MCTGIAGAPVTVIVAAPGAVAAGTTKLSCCAEARYNGACRETPALSTIVTDAPPKVYGSGGAADCAVAAEARLNPNRLTISSGAIFAGTDPAALATPGIPIALD